MANRNKASYQSSAIWFGFALGATVACASAYFLGTKKGRQTLSKILDLTEDFEGNMKDIFKQWENHISEPLGEVLDKKMTQTVKPTLGNLLDKMKYLVPHEEKKVKKFFVKDGKFT